MKKKYCAIDRERVFKLERFYRSNGYTHMTFVCLSTTMDSSSSDDDDIIVALLLKKRKRVKRSKWVHEINSSRVEKGEFISLFPELLCFEDKFKSYFRVYPAQFYDILALVRQDITKENTLLRTSITAEERLALCLRYVY